MYFMFQMSECVIHMCEHVFHVSEGVIQMCEHVIDVSEFHYGINRYQHILICIDIVLIFRDMHKWDSSRDMFMCLGNVVTLSLGHENNQC
jgi:hypothetical protein